MWKKMTKCKACEAEIAKSASRCPHCGAYQHTAQLICMAILAFLLIVLVEIPLIRQNSSEPKLVGFDSNVSASVTPAEQPLLFGVGDVAELKDIQVTLTSIEESSGSQFLTPDSGNTFLICHFNIENNSQSDIGVSSLLSFSAYVDDYATSLSLSAIASSAASQLDGSVAAGRKMAGVVGYEVPEDWAELEIHFTPNFWSRKDIIFSASNSSK